MRKFVPTQQQLKIEKNFMLRFEILKILEVCDVKNKILLISSDKQAIDKRSSLLTKGGAYPVNTFASYPYSKIY